ncbi:hypothetical protein STEG23_030127, partial [Scotinomys teguina]
MSEDVQRISSRMHFLRGYPCSRTESHTHTHTGLAKRIPHFLIVIGCLKIIFEVSITFLNKIESLLEIFGDQLLDEGSIVTVMVGTNLIIGEGQFGYPVYYCPSSLFLERFPELCLMFS